MKIAWKNIMVQRLLLAPLVAAMFLLWASLIPSAAAQITPRDPVPEPLPELPSVSEYSLPPGEDTSASSNQAEGPVVEDALPPSPVPAEETITPTGPASSRTPLPSVALPSTPIPNVTEPSGSSTNQPRRVAPARSSPRTTAPPVTSNNSVRPITGEADTGPEPGFSFDEPDNINPANNPIDPALNTADSASESSPENSGVNISIFVGFILLLALGGGFLLWRRNKARPRATGNPIPEKTSTIEETPMPAIQGKPAAAPASPPEPAAEPKPSSVIPDGFVTSKMGVTPSPAPAARSATVQNFGSARPQRWDHLEIDFVAEGAASTLLNAVLTYRVTLTNKTGETLTKLVVSGAMMQADDKSGQNGMDQREDPLHEIAVLDAGESVVLSGEMRLPLQAIKPITIKSQALFIPLARFAIAYLDGDDVSHLQQAAFVVGQEHEPPRAKMAPFRLDLGPRRFTAVGQRPLLAGP